MLKILSSANCGLNVQFKGRFLLRVYRIVVRRTVVYSFVYMSLVLLEYPWNSKIRYVSLRYSSSDKQANTPLHNRVKSVHKTFFTWSWFLSLIQRPVTSSSWPSNTETNSPVDTLCLRIWLPYAQNNDLDKDNIAECQCLPDNDLYSSKKTPWISC